MSIVLQGSMLAASSAGYRSGRAHELVKCMLSNTAKATANAEGKE